MNRPTIDIGNILLGYYKESKIFLVYVFIGLVVF